MALRPARGGIDRNAALVIAPASTRVAWRLWRYTPAAVTRRTERQLAWARATFPAQPAEPAGPDHARQPATTRGGGRDD